jgi:hypothetical protein
VTEPTAADRDILATVFASRVSLAKKTQAEALKDAAREWEAATTWIASNSKKEGSFLWYCCEFDLDPGAVRRAIVKEV